MSEIDGADAPIVINVEDAPTIERARNAHYGAAYKKLTPSMRPRGGALGVNWMKVEKGQTACPFHAHLREDEVFFVLSGRGVLRYGETVQTIKAGDCISCPAGTGTAHQIANPHDEDLIYLSIGPFDPHEVCTYPDNGKVLVRGIQQIGTLEQQQYFDNEPEVPLILSMLPDET